MTFFFLLTLLGFVIFLLLPFYVIVYGESTSCHSTYSMVAPFRALHCLIFCILSWNSSLLVLLEMHNDASFSTLASLSSFNSGFKHFTQTGQAQTNQLLSNVCSRNPVLQYLFVKVLPCEDILYQLMKQKITYMLFYKHNVYLGWPQYAYGFSNLNLILPFRAKSRI